MNIIKLFVSGLLFLGISHLLSAQESDIEIEEIIISDDNDYISDQTKISKLNLFFPRTVGDIFKNMSGINIVKRSGFAVEPSLRMFKREQLNLMIDGGTKITHSCANRMDAMTTRISAGEIEKIEVIKGPYSVRFGQSFGAVINIITKHPKPRDEFKLYGSTDMTYEFNNSGFSNSLEFGGSGKKIDFLLNGTYRDYDNYLSGNGTEIASGFTAYDYSGKLGYSINKKNRIQASFRQSFAKDVLHAGLPMDAVNDNGKLLSLDYLYKHSTGIISALKIKFFASMTNHLMSNELKKNFAFVYALAPVESKTLGAKTELTFSLNNKMNLYSGLDYYYKSRDGVRNKEIKINACTGAEFDPPGEATDKIWQNSYTADLGVFAELNYQVSETVNLKSGIRSDFIQSDILDPEEDFSAFYNENIRPNFQNSLDFFAEANINLPNSFKISIAGGKASRTPDLLELFINHSTVGQDAYEYLGNPLLRSEKNMQADLVLSKKGKTYFVYIDIFYSYIKDFITARVDTMIPRKFLPCMMPEYTKQFVNTDKVYQYGLDAGFKFALIDDLIFQTNANYTYAQNLSWDEPVPEISPFTLNINLTYTFKAFIIDLNNRYVSSQERVAESFGETASEGFNILNFNINFKPFKFMTVGFAIDNITDVNYYEHTSRPYRNMDENLMFFEPGRNFKLALRLSF